MLDRLLIDLVPRILNGPTGRRWFGDGAPKWSQGRAGKPAKTSGEADGERRQLVKVLRRHGKGNKEALLLAEKIAACRPGGRCLSGACPECMRATQRFFVATNADLLARSSVSTVAVSVILRNARVADGKLELEPDLFGPLLRRLREALRKAGVRQAVGGFDVSANEHEEQRFAPHYRPHAWFIVPASQMARGDKVFREYFPASRTVRRPVRMQEFDGDLRGLAYAVKTDFVRRISLPRQTLADGSVTRRNTRDRPLLGCQRVEIAVALDRARLGARIFLHGLGIVKTPDGVRIVRTEAIKRPTCERQETRVPSPRVDGRLTTTRAALRPGAPPNLSKEPTPAGARRSTSEPTRRPIGKGDDPHPNKSTERRTKPRSTSPSKHAGNGVKKPVPKKGE